MILTGMNVSQNLIYHNTKIKHYPNGIDKISVASRNVYKEKGWEQTEQPFKEKEKVLKPQNKENSSRNDSKRRAMNTVFDIAAMSNFDYFITFTLDGSKIDRYSAEEVMKPLKNFLRNCVQRYGLKYLLIPERHKDGAIHIHGLISGNMKFVDSGTVAVKGYSKPMKLETFLKKNIPIENAHTVYNMPQWKFGYSTAVAIYGDTLNCAKYITKYITKDVQKIFGNFYYAGGDIIRKVPYTLSNIDFESISADTYYCEAIATSFKFLEERSSSNDFLGMV